MNNALKAIRDIRNWQESLIDKDFICSSWAEICPWYRRGLGQFALARLWNRPLSFLQKFKVLVTNFRNLIYCPQILLSCPSVNWSEAEEIFVTWALSDRDSVSTSVGRYYGKSVIETAGLAAFRVLVICSFKPEKDQIARLTNDGAIVIYDAPARPISNILRFLRGLLRLGCIGLDAEYWRGVAVSDLVLSGLARTHSSAIKFYLPYEQQPWQLKLIDKLKSMNGSTVTVVGDIHSSMTNIPIQWGKMKIAPDQLIVHGTAYQRVLVDQLGWDASQISLEPSRRYHSKIKLEKDTIFLPYDFGSERKILELISRLLPLIGPENRSFELRIHPAQMKVATHQSLHAAILSKTASLKSYQSTKIARTEPLAIIIGVSTTLLEVLEAGYTAIGIYEDPAYEAYSSEIWTELESVELAPGIYKYKLLKQNSFILYSNQNPDQH